MSTATDWSPSQGRGPPAGPRRSGWGRGQTGAGRSPQWHFALEIGAGAGPGASTSRSATALTQPQPQTGLSNSQQPDSAHVRSRGRSSQPDLDHDHPTTTPRPRVAHTSPARCPHGHAHAPPLSSPFSTQSDPADPEPGERGPLQIVEHLAPFEGSGLLGREMTRGLEPMAGPKAGGSGAGRAIRLSIEGARRRPS
jgi:hypothetical protein